MAQTVLSHHLGVTLVGGGPFLPTDLDKTVAFAPLLIAADGGADGILETGRVPDWVIGDLDSISSAARARFGGCVIHDPCQDTTDFQKCLTRIKAPLVLGLGFLGGRVDHELAALSQLVRHPRPVILLGAQDVVAHIPETIDLDLPPGTRVSLFPMAPVTGRSTGLTWPIDGLTFAPSAQVGTSNRAEGLVHLAFDGPGMLLILPRSCLGVLRRALG